MVRYSKVIGPRMYIRPIREVDTEALRDAMSDWRADGVQMTDDQATLTIKEWVGQMQRNHQNFFKASADPNNQDAFVVDPANVFERTWCYDGFYLNDTDECIGFQIGKFVGKKYEHRAVMLRPSFRGQGYYSESSGLGAKTLFLQIKNCTGMTATVPVEPSVAMRGHLDKSIWASDDLEIKNYTSVERIDPVTYSKQEISKEQWLEWYNADEQADFRSETYEYKILEE